MSFNVSIIALTNGTCEGVLPSSEVRYSSSKKKLHSSFQDASCNSSTRVIVELCIVGKRLSFQHLMTVRFGNHEKN